MQRSAAVGGYALPSGSVDREGLERAARPFLGLTSGGCALLDANLCIGGFEEAVGLTPESKCQVSVSLGA